MRKTKQLISAFFLIMVLAGCSSAKPESPATEAPVANACVKLEKGEPAIFEHKIVLFKGGVPQIKEGANIQFTSFEKDTCDRKFVLIQNRRGEIIITVSETFPIGPDTKVEVIRVNAPDITGNFNIWSGAYHMYSSALGYDEVFNIIINFNGTTGENTRDVSLDLMY